MTTCRIVNCVFLNARVCVCVCVCIYLLSKASLQKGFYPCHSNVPFHSHELVRDACVGVCGSV